LGSKSAYLIEFLHTLKFDKVGIFEIVWKLELRLQKELVLPTNKICRGYIHNWSTVLFYVLFLSIVLLYVLFVCGCVLCCCHRASTKLQLNISYRIISYHFVSAHIKPRN